MDDQTVRLSRPGSPGRWSGRPLTALSSQGALDPAASGKACGGTHDSTPLSSEAPLQSPSPCEDPATPPPGHPVPGKQGSAGGRAPAAAGSHTQQLCLSCCCAQYMGTGLGQPRARPGQQARHWEGSARAQCAPVRAERGGYRAPGALGPPLPQRGAGLGKKLSSRPGWGRGPDVLPPLSSAASSHILDSRA